MKMHSQYVFDLSIDRANEWVKDFMRELNMDDYDLAREVLCSTLEAIRDRLPVSHAVKLGEQLPLVMGERYMQSYKPDHCPVWARDFDDFCRHLHTYIGGMTDRDEESVLRALYKILAQGIALDEIDDIVDIMPKELHEMWQYRPRHAYFNRQYGTPANQRHLAVPGSRC